MKKYLALAALVFAGNVYASEASVEATVAQEEVVLSEKDMAEALETAQRVMSAIVEEMKAEEAQTEAAAPQAEVAGN